MYAKRLTNFDPGQVLVYFAVAKKGEAPTDGKTDLNPEGLTAAYGPHAETIAHLLHANGLSCSLPAKPDFVAAMLEKLVWIWWVASVFSHGGLFSQVHTKQALWCYTVQLDYGHFATLVQCLHGGGRTPQGQGRRGGAAVPGRGELLLL